MCGRYSLTTSPEALRRLFNFTTTPNFEARYNVAPTQAAPVVRASEDDGRTLTMLRWGLIPSWAKEASIGSKMINARAETAAEKPSFRAAFKARRCLVPSDGFYEWRTEDGKKQPFRIGMKGGDPFAFAGLWESWTAPDDAGDLAGQIVETFTILTTDANAKLKPIHHRMPVILPPDRWDTWLGAPANDVNDLRSLLSAYPPEPMAFYRVNPVVNNARNDTPECIEPLNSAVSGA